MKSDVYYAIKAHRKPQPLKTRIWWFFMATYLCYKFRLQDYLRK